MAGAEFLYRLSRRDRASSLQSLQEATQKYLQEAQYLPEIAQVSTTLKSNVSQFFANNREKAKSMGVGPYLYDLKCLFDGVFMRIILTG
jgi:multidrug efflux pump subunit AcrB